MEKKEMLYEGKAKKVFATEDPALCVVSYKDDATAFNGEKKGTIVGKGVVNNRMSNFMFKLLEKNGVPTDYVEELNDRDTVLKKVQIVPLEVIVRNKAAGYWFFQIFTGFYSKGKRYHHIIVFQKVTSSAPDILCRLLSSNFNYFLIRHRNKHLITVSGRIDTHLYPIGYSSSKDKFL